MKPHTKQRILSFRNLLNQNKDIHICQLFCIKLINILIKFYIVLGLLAADTQILLTSALYFKGKWLKSFDKAATRVRCFRVPQRGCQDVPMMESTSRYRYAYIASLDADVVEIPYSVRYNPSIIDKKKLWCFHVKQNSHKDNYLMYTYGFKMLRIPKFASIFL